MTGINLLLTFIVSQFSLLSVQPLSVHLLSLFYDLRLTTRRLGWVTAEPSTLRYEPLLLGSSNTAPGPISWEASELGMHHGITRREEGKYHDRGSRAGGPRAPGSGQRYCERGGLAEGVVARHP